MDIEKSRIFNTEKRKAFLVQETRFLCTPQNHRGGF